VFSTKIVDHGGRRGNVMRALARWRHPVALFEAQDVLHRAMRPTSHRRIPMAIEMASNLIVFGLIVDSLFAHNHS
jgi:hypothetical protein